MAKAKGSYHDVESYQAEDDLRTLLSAAKIEKDPKRIKAARECAREKHEAMMAISMEKD